MKSFDQFLNESGGYAVADEVVNAGGSEPTGQEAEKPAIQEHKDVLGIHTGIAEPTGTTAKLPKIHEGLAPAKLQAYQKHLENSLSVLGDANIKRSALASGISSTEYAKGVEVISSIYEIISDQL